MGHIDWGGLQRLVQRLDRLGTSSVIYGLGVFRKGVEETAAVGRFVHVTVDRVTRRPVPMPDMLRAALLELTP